MTLQEHLSAALPLRARPLTEADIPALLALCRGNRAYYEHADLRPTAENLTADLTGLPPGKALEDKHFLGLWAGDELAAALDVITGYPDGETAWVGWLILEEKRQGQGLGSAAMQALWAWLAREGYRRAALAVLAENRRAMAFWQRQGFAPRGADCPSTLGQVQLMDKCLEGWDRS